MHVCLAVAWYVHFRQNDRDLLRATAVTQGWNGYRNLQNINTRDVMQKARVHAHAHAHVRTYVKHTH